MECKFCDEFTGICTNGECPMRGDCCPVPDTEGLCKFEEREERVYKLTPKGCASCALLDAGLIESTNDPLIDEFWERFSELMEKFGYVANDNDAEKGET